MLIYVPRIITSIFLYLQNIKGNVIELRKLQISMIVKALIQFFQEPN